VIDTRHNYQNYFKPPSLLTRLAGITATVSRWESLAFGIDISRYQKITPANWANLKPVIDFVMAKCSEGYDWIDPTFADNVQQAYTVDIPLVAYHYFRTSYYVEYGHDVAKWPTPANDKQLQNLIHALSNKTYYAVMLDVEDTTEAAPWTAWAAGVFAGRVRDWLDSIGKHTTPMIIYTGEWYWLQAKAEFSWMTKYQMSVAKYPYAKDSIVTTWEDLRKSYFPPETSSIPTLANARWDFWQFSGDKFILPYVTNANGGATCLDLNFFNGTKAQLYEYLHFAPKGTPEPIPTPTPAPTTKTLEERVADLEVWQANIRKA
jgi:GH25 family lysozyme M1 (1,4-beta-N-acetylmuramidase)